jgi:hypothetical protein
VEFVARDRAAFAPILADRRADVRVFEKGRASKALVETELRRHKRDFNLEQLRVLVP